MYHNYFQGAYEMDFGTHTIKHVELEIIIWSTFISINSIS